MSIVSQISPGVMVTETDLTTIVPGVSTSTGAFVGQFNWGPINQPVLVDSETTLVRTFQPPTDSSLNSFVGSSFFTCSNFLSYSNSLYVVRSIGANGKNAGANSNNTISISNYDEFEFTYLNTSSNNAFGAFTAKYPGAMGSSLSVSVCAESANFSTWAYKDYFDGAPGTSEFAANKNSSNDELHLVVIDTLGKFSGTANTVLEKFAYLSKASDVIGVDGQNNYYKNVLARSSRYVYAIDPVSYANTSAYWGRPCSDVSNYSRSVANETIRLNGGSDGETIQAGNLEGSWDLFADKEKYDVSLLITGAAGDIHPSVPNYVVSNIIGGIVGSVAGRKDAIAFISPRYIDVVNTAGSELDNISTAYLNDLSLSSSYAVVDSGWKYQYDKYNNIYRWIPLNGDIAGLCAQTDMIADPWYSPAGFTRGQIKNVTKLAWNPTQAERDALYKLGVNSVVSFAGQGTVLFGDKTLQAKPSAFDRINVRRLFIVLEKAISTASQYSLFEFNDDFTRAQFVAMVEPYLRSIQGRRGILDFKVQCDRNNNTQDIIDRNAFVADIFIKPARSINFIQLNFVATRSGVDFTTIVGQNQ